MKTPEKKALALLSKQGFTVLSGEESLDLYINEIGWNVRSIARQADILETTILELKKQQAGYVALVPGSDSDGDDNAVREPGKTVKNDE